MEKESKRSNEAERIVIQDQKNQIKREVKQWSGKNSPFFGKHQSVEHKQNISKAKLGKTLSEKTKKKMRDSQIRRRQREKEIPYKNWIDSYFISNPSNS